MPNDTDLFQLLLRVRSLAATIVVGSYIQGYNLGQGVAIPITYNPGSKPAATEIGLGLWSGETGEAAATTAENARNAANDRIDDADGSNANNWFSGSEDGSSDGLTLAVTYANGAFENTPPTNKTGSINGSMPANIANDTSYYGLIAIRQGPLTNP